MSQQGSQIGDTGLNNATEQTKGFDGKFDSNIQPKTVNLTLSTYEDPLYGQTTRLKVDKEVKTGNYTMIKNITDDTLGPKIHPSNIQEVSNDIKSKLSGIDTKFVEGFNNPEHANSCSKGLLNTGKQSDINTIICQLRQTYEKENDVNNKKELFNFITFLKGKVGDTNWRVATYETTAGIKESAEAFYKKLLGKATPEIDHTVVVEQIKNKSKELFDKLASTNNVVADILTYSKPANDNTPAANQLEGIKQSLDVITNIANNTKFNTYLYNLNELEKRFNGQLFMKYTVVSTPKPFSKDEIYNYITNANASNVASRFASSASANISSIGSNVKNMVNTQMAQPTAQPAQPVDQSTAPAPAPETTQALATPPAAQAAPAPKSSWWPFGKGGKSKKNKKSHSKKQKKNSRKQQKRRKSSKK
jgi:hypothetical protein